MRSSKLKKGNSWNKVLGKVGLTLKEARELQRKLASQVIEKDQFEKIENICGLDVSYYKDTGIACGVVLNCEDMRVLEERVAYKEVSFPYIPTLLSFRETPLILEVAKSLKSKVDLFMVDSNGRLHPYLLGAASHFGVLMDKSTIGVAKTLLCGEVQPKKTEERYSYVMLNGKAVGAAVTTRLGAKPVYVSVGHKISLKTAIETVLETSKLRIPEPIRRADHLSKMCKKDLRNKHIN
ncbi:MAG: endonuclease V [Candidatus Jordarchaeum sp.]|uniref:endonuclease V n=1 Tax=Candidatus Jordarchaeum sp. TaxID=2823881 RepID=UPI004048F2ED